MKNDVVLKEYVRRLSDDDLEFLNSRINQNLSGDCAYVLDFLSRNRDVDKALGSANDSEEFWQTLDLIFEYVLKEYTRRRERR